MLMNNLPLPKKSKSLSRLSQWLQEYSQAHGITLTELSRDAGLSDGTLRSLMYYPDRLPTMETCLRLARATGESVRTVLQLAGLPESAEIEHYDVNGARLMKVYRGLPPQIQRMLLEIALTLHQNFSEQPTGATLEGRGEH